MSKQSPSAVPPPQVDGGYQLDGIRKSYVTSAGEATHYFFIYRIGDARADLIMALASDAAYQDMAAMMYRADDARPC